MTAPHYTSLLATVVVCALVDAASFVVARVWVLPTFGDDWADAVIYTTGLVFPLLVVWLTPKVRNRRRPRHRSWGWLTHLIEQVGGAVGG